MAINTSLPSLAVPQYGSQEYFQNVADIYGQTTAPSMARSTAQLKNLLGGRGTLYGTPLYGKYMEGIEKPYQAGLQNLIGQEVSGASKYFAEKPLQEAGVTGTYQGLPTLAKQQYERQYAEMTPYQQEQVNAASKAQELAMMSNLYSAFGGVQGIMNLLARLVGQDPGSYLPK